MDVLRIPPHNIGAEQGVLGSILLQPDSIGRCLDAGISCDDFYDWRHECLFDQLVAMAASNMAMDAITIAEWLGSKNVLDKVGGYDYLVELQDHAIVPAHCEYYSQIVLKDSKYRRIISEASEAIDSAYKCEIDPEDILGQTHNNLYSISKDKSLSGESNLIVADRIIQNWKDIKAGKKTGLPWNVKEIGDVFGNFQAAGNPYFLGAEPGGGKSVELQNLMTMWALMDEPCAFASLEMTHDKLLARILAEQADVSLWGLENGKYGEGTHNAELWIDKVEKIKSKITSLPLYINDRPMNTDQLCTYAMRMYEKHGIKAFGVDYFQLLNPPASRKAEGLEAVKYNCGKLQEFSKLTGVITIVLSQLTKLPTDKTGNPRPPRQDDFFGGRIIDAHSEGSVIFHTKDERNIASIVKNRGGGTGDIEFFFNKKRLRFEST